VTESASQQNQGVSGISARTTSWLAWSVCAASLLIFALSFVLIFLGWSTQMPKDWASWQEQAGTTVVFVGVPIVGGLIASHRPANSYGWLWLALGMSFALMQFGQAYASYALVAELGSLPAPRTVVTVLGQGWGAAIIIVPFLFLLFPNGHLPSPRWRLVAWVTLLAGVPLLILAPFVSDEGGMAPVDNPLVMHGTAAAAISALIDPGITVIFAAIVISVASLVFRYLRAAGIQRQQIKWFAYVAALNGFLVSIDTLGLTNLLLSYPLGDAVWNVLSGVAFASLYAAVGIAIMRHRLYDIDVLINRTLVYGSLTVLLAATYIGGVVSLQYVLRALTGQGSTLAVVASTLAIAALFNPLRGRVQSLVDRRFYRSKYNAAKTLEAFNVRLREETDLDALSNEVVRVARRTMQPAHASLWLRPDPEPEARSAAIEQFGHNE
jgi:hypothetical protein